MNISKISSVTFRENTQAPKVENSGVNKPTAENSKHSDEKGFIHSKNMPYVIGGVAVTAATVLGIIGVKKGWFSKSAKQVIRDGENLISGKNETSPTIIKPADEHIPEPKPTVKPSDEPAIEPAAEIKSAVEPEIKPVLEPTPEAVNPKLNEEAAIIEKPEKNVKIDPNAAKVTDDDVIEALDNLEKIEALKREEKLANMPKYLTKYMTPEEALKGIEDGSISPLQRAIMFIKEFDNNIEDLVRNLDNQYPVINNLNKGLRRYKKDFTAAFDSWIADPNSGYRGTYKVIGNTIHESRPDSSKVIYIFDKGPEGGLRTIRDIPEDTNRLTGIMHFNPERYKDFGNGIGIQHLDKMEYIDSKTGKLVQSIEIDPVDRSFHNVIVNNPKTGNPVLTLERTAEPNHLYYNVELFNSENGERISKINTKNLSE